MKSKESNILYITSKCTF